jgi:hypothetical protein
VGNGVFAPQHWSPARAIGLLGMALEMQGVLKVVYEEKREWRFNGEKS